MEILNVKNLNFQYSLSSKKNVIDANFAINKGEFVCVCGPTGSGKSTLLRMLKRELIPLGERSGTVEFEGVDIEKMSDRDSASAIGFVFQRPEQQIVTDKVWHELAFGLENLNLSRRVIASRIAETVSFFGIEDWYERNISELSGGQKQLLNLAAVMVMQPQILILDEPLSQLDPIASSDFVAILKKLNTELSLTVIIAEHCLESILPISDKMMVIENGKILSFDTPKKTIADLNRNSSMLSAMPLASKLYCHFQISRDTPISVREGRNFLECNFKNSIKSLDIKPYFHSENKAVEIKNVYLRYQKNDIDVLNDLSLTVYENEIYSILGGNGSGKTTTLSLIAGLRKAYSGKIRIFGKNLKDYKNQSLYQGCLAMLPQDVQTLFLKNTVREEMTEFGEKIDLPFDFSHLYDAHPYDLSGGEQQMLAIAKVLALKPKILLLDEPTKGVDADSKFKLADIFKKLKNDGMTIIFVTHDVEFAAICADRCSLFFRGKIVSEGTPTELFSENHFYTTAASRLTRGFFDNTVTLEQVVELCEKNGFKDGVSNDCNKK